MVSDFFWCNYCQEGSWASRVHFLDLAVEHFHQNLYAFLTKPTCQMLPELLPPFYKRGWSVSTCHTAIFVFCFVCHYWWENCGSCFSPFSYEEGCGVRGVGVKFHFDLERQSFQFLTVTGCVAAKWLIVLEYFYLLELGFRGCLLIGKVTYEVDNLYIFCLLFLPVFLQNTFFRQCSSLASVRLVSVRL